MLRRMAALPSGSTRRTTLRTTAIEGLVPVADRIARRYANRGESPDDLVQVARVGLVKAVDGFDPALGGFLGYAVPTIQGELKRYFRDQCWDVRVPRELQELRRDVQRTVDELAQRAGHDPTSAEVAAALRVDRRAVLAALGSDRAYSTASLNLPVRRDGQSCEVGDLIGARDERVELVADRVSLRPALDQLPDRERELLFLRYFENQTQSQIAARVGLSQMHVSRLITRTLAGLRAWIEGDSDRVDVCGQRTAARRTPRRPAGFSGVA
ncbi:SigB/SigF/SigG family RNA polymerase sigma factor [Actinocatenispora rupis]|uniref:RNA polymerase sigma-B factor n=1 Tax=Actinocatenispora rupis TaxID=519421 RepID=A0A8J3NAM1_9ACTN|nr:SigB/SigF/SigG family RNA polymerase sigma factor [Actinocatenispora rupis]GID09830.1 hypothetical protein Aru02nite_07190 [Actinocatenispora rupis]